MKTKLKAWVAISQKLKLTLNLLKYTYLSVALFIEVMDFILMVNKQGQTRLAHYYNKFLPLAERISIETELIRSCLNRPEDSCCSFTYRKYVIIFRRYASLYFIVGIDAKYKDINQLAILEFIHFLVETYDKYFENVCELDLMFSLEKAHFILDEMVSNGRIVETSKDAVLMPLHLMERICPSSNNSLMGGGGGGLP